MRALAFHCLYGAVWTLLYLPAAVLAEGPAGYEAVPPSPDQAFELPAPHWNLGDRWTVETVSRPTQVRLGLAPDSISQPIAWQFVLSQSETLGAHDCFRIEVRCQAAGKQPETVLWIDRNSLALRQITTQMPVPGGFREMTVRYDFGSGQAAPVLGPLTALPIDTPVFRSGHAKGLTVFSYRSDFGPRQRKAVGDIGFAHLVEQRIAVLSPEEVRELLDETFAKNLSRNRAEPLPRPSGNEATNSIGIGAKSLTVRPVTEVRLKSHGREVRQLWQAQRPWPIYCDNGYSVSRLVSFSSGAKNESSADDHDPSNEEDRP